MAVSSQAMKERVGRASVPSGQSGQEAILPAHIQALFKGLQSRPSVRRIRAEQPSQDPSGDAPNLPLSDTAKKDDTVLSNIPGGNPEGTPTPELPNKGVTVKFANLESLTEFIADSSNLIFDSQDRAKLAKGVLRDPINDFEVSISAGEEDYDLTAKFTLPEKIQRYDIGSAFSDDKERASFVKLIGYEIDEDFEPRGNSIVVKGPNGNKIIVGITKADRDRAQLTVSTSKLPERYDSKQITDAPRRDDSEEKIKAELLDFADVLERAVNGLYSALDITLPDDTITIKGPEKAYSGRYGTYSPTNTSSRESEPVTDREGIKVENRFLGKYTVEISEVSFDDVGGNKEAKEELKGIALAIQHQDEFLDVGVDSTKGILLYGLLGPEKPN